MRGAFDLYWNGLCSMYAPKHKVLVALTGNLHYLLFVIANPGVLPGCGNPQVDTSNCELGIASSHKPLLAMTIFLFRTMAERIFPF